MATANLYNRSVKVEFENRITGETFYVSSTGETEGIKINFQVEKQISTEPNVAYIDIYNLADSTRNEINYVQDLYNINFGHKINVTAGYKDQEKLIFSGVIVYANSTKDGTEYVTRINARNIFFELMVLPIKRTAAKGEKKSSLILKILDDIGATLATGSKTVIEERLQGATFSDTTTFQGPASKIINEINEGLVDRIQIYFDDIGVGFNPLGVALDIDTAYYSKYSGLLGTVDITETGADFKVLLDPTLRINAPVKLDSDTINSTYGGRYVIKKIIHVGTNRADGPFETRCQAVYEYLKLPSVS